MRKILLSIFLAIIISILSISCAKADGGVFVPPDYYTFEKDQKAFIYYHNGIEDLVISTSYQGNSEYFTWVVPTPSKPEVNKSTASIFENLNNIARIKSGTQSFSTKSFNTAYDSIEPTIEIIERKNIDIYDTTILKASNENVLSQWMKENRYTFPEEQSYFLSDYTDNDWYFVISKIRPELTESEKVASNLASGNITPLRFSFSSDRIIYPMKLTNLANEHQKNAYKTENNMDWYSPISASLYVLSDNKVIANDFTLSYANWLKQDEISSIVDNATEKKWLNPTGKMFLTRLYSNDVSSITDDLIIRNDTNNNVYPLPFYKQPEYVIDIIIGFFTTLLLFILSPLFIGNIIFKLISKIKNNNKYFLISHSIATIISLLILLSFPIIVYNRGFYIYSSTYDIHYIIENGKYLGIFSSLLIITVLMILYLIKITFRKNDYVKN